ncbi:MAG: hypothetical protein RSD74_00965 [Angelakisella sp.]
MNYFITNEPLSILEEAERINWTGFGFSVQEVSKAVGKGFQQQDGERTVSILPIANEALLQERLGTLPKTTEDGGYYRIITEAEAIAERDRLKAANDLAEEVRRNTPTDDDIFKAQQLKLLTEINMKLGTTGGATNV